MGEHRATINISFSIHGKEYKLDTWINYFPDDATGVDPRIIDFFVSSWEDSMWEYYDAEHQREIEKIEKEDRELYERLKKKFEPGSGGI
jgi:hypothetical protein